MSKIILALFAALTLAACGSIAPRTFDISDCDGDQTDPVWCGTANDGPSDRGHSEDNGDDGDGDGEDGGDGGTGKKK